MVGHARLLCMGLTALYLKRYVDYHLRILLPSLKIIFLLRNLLMLTVLHLNKMRIDFHLCLPFHTQ